MKNALSNFSFVAVGVSDVCGARLVAGHIGHGQDPRAWIIIIIIIITATDVQQDQQTQHCVHASPPQFQEKHFA